jgi:hypothetical protein
LLGTLGIRMGALLLVKEFLFTKDCLCLPLCARAALARSSVAETSSNSNGIG